MHFGLAISSISAFSSSYKARRCRQARTTPAYQWNKSRPEQTASWRRVGISIVDQWDAGRPTFRRSRATIQHTKCFVILPSWLFFTPLTCKITAKVHVPKGESLSQGVLASVLSSHAFVNSAENEDNGAHNFAQCLQCRLR